VHEGEFPGEVESVLDAGVRAETEGGWVAMDGVAETVTALIVSKPGLPVLLEDC
jgi:hypothetical protein